MRYLVILEIFLKRNLRKCSRHRLLSDILKREDDYIETSLTIEKVGSTVDVISVQN